jgi:hypothetical protein
MIPLYVDVLWVEGSRENSAYMCNVVSNFVLYGALGVIAGADGYMYVSLGKNGLLPNCLSFSVKLVLLISATSRCPVFRWSVLSDNLWCTL